MATTLKQTEAVPVLYPDAIGSPPAISPAALQLDPAALWQRLEEWVAHRWSEREVVWIVEGPGDWQVPLAPAIIETVEVWQAGEFHEVEGAQVSALGGLVLPGAGPYRVTATVGADSEPPAAVVTAWRRLAEYLAEREFDAVAAGASSFSATAGAVQMNFRRNPAYMARALENSGAADLLRRWRRA